MKIYTCNNCDGQFPKWLGRCTQCGAWGSISEQEIEASNNKNKNATTASVAPASFIDLSKLAREKLQRLSTGINEIDRVFGSGITAGSITLLGGEPGIGKSTLVAQIADALQKQNHDIAYISGEESAGQIKSRLDRLHYRFDKLHFISETNTEKIISALKQLKPALAIIDSIQTIYSQNIGAESGSLNQIRASAVQLLELAKEHNIAIIIIGHITKDGAIAGPKTLEHLVDTVLYLEMDQQDGWRFLRSIKNRFGSTNELGILEMTEAGLVEAKDPSAFFLSTNKTPIIGGATGCVIEGLRPFLVEAQALVSKTIFGYPQRKSSGFDVNRLQILSAVITKKTKINLSNQDIIFNLIGGLKANEPALDLAVCGAIISSVLNKNFDQPTLMLGEVGLAGEIRPVGKLNERLKEAERHGFTTAIIPRVEVKGGMNLRKIGSIGELVGLF